MSVTAARAFLRCTEGACLNRFPISSRFYTCPECHGLLDVEYQFDKAVNPVELKGEFKARRLSEEGADRSGVWRFRELLPFVTDLSKIITLAEGNTPIYSARGSARYVAMDRLRFKHQGLNPTGSFKDNGMTTGVTRARDVGAAAVACASTGNTSASMAAYAASADIRAIVFIPEGQVSYGKLAQALEFGASVIEIEGNFDDAMRIVRQLAEETEVYLLNSVNPFRLEGQKTIMIELMEQLGWQAPDWIVLPGGNLGNTSAFGKALHELLDAGFIDRMPRLAVIQAEGAAPFYDLYHSADRSRLSPIEHPETLATAIRIGNPVSWKKALRSLAWTNGIVERVSEQEIAEAKAVIGRDGIGCEPASAVTLAGVKRLVASGVIGNSQDVVCILTGNLLKDPGYTIDYHAGELSFSDSSGKRAVGATLANRPQKAGADKTAIRRLLNLG